MMETAYGKLEEFTQDLKGQNEKAQKENDALTERLTYLERRFSHMKMCLEEKEEEVLHLKHEMKRLRTVRAYEQKIRRNTELMEEQMREKIGNITRAVSSSFSSGTHFQTSYERKNSSIKSESGSGADEQPQQGSQVAGGD